MKASFIFVALSAALLVMSGCGQASHQEEDVFALRKSNANTENVTADSASVGGADAAIPERKFVRTSEIKFRVKDVSAATTQIEHIVRSNNGFVTYTNLKSNVEQQKTMQKSMDSSLESIQYTMHNDIVLRVPNTKLDSTLSAIATLVDYMDYRVIKADDVALQIKANQKAQQRAIANGRLIQNAATRKGEIHDATDAAALTDDKQKEADDAEISNLSLMDQVAYSTVNLSIYQRMETKYWVIANADNNLLKTNIGIRIWDSIKTGWYFAEDVFVGIMNLWFVVVLGIIGYLIYRRYAATRKKTALLSKP